MADVLVILVPGHLEAGHSDSDRGGFEGNTTRAFQGVWIDVERSLPGHGARSAQPRNNAFAVEGELESIGKSEVTVALEVQEYEGTGSRCHGSCVGLRVQLQVGVELCRLDEVALLGLMRGFRLKNGLTFHDVMVWNKR